jgi:hypothetical protein
MGRHPNPITYSPKHKKDPKMGQDPVISTPSCAKVQALEDQIKHQQQVLQILKDNLTMEQNHMKQQVDQHRSERSFELGDGVFLRLQPYKQMSLKQAKKDNKLS